MYVAAPQQGDEEGSVGTVAVHEVHEMSNTLFSGCKYNTRQQPSLVCPAGFGGTWVRVKHRGLENY